MHIASDFITACVPDLTGSLTGDKASSVVFDNSKIKRWVPDFRATITFSQGIRRTLAWFEADPARQQIDDALDVFAVHGVGGTFGAIATGVFATVAINAYPGLIDGNAGQVLTQLISVGATIAFAVVATFVIVKVVDGILGIRISPKEEEVGIDLSTHGEVAYQA